VVYTDIYDAKTACDHLSGFNVQNRYLIVLYYNPSRQNKKLTLKEEVGGAARRGGLRSSDARQARTQPPGALPAHLPPLPPKSD